MKKFLVFITAAALVCLCAQSCRKVIPPTALPQPVQAFMQTHFAAYTVSYATYEHREYDVLLMDGSELEFKKDGEWTNIDMEYAAVPVSVLATLPPAIPAYLESSFPGVAVKKIEKGFWYGYKVELMNDLELIFSSEGEFKRIDD